MLELENSSLLPPSPGSLLCFYYWLQLTVTATHQSECDTGVCAGACQLITQRPYMMGCLKTMPQNSYTTPMAFEQITGKLSFLSFSLAELGVFSFPSSSTEFSAA